MKEKRLFSGIQPSGILHLGNYLGAIKNWVALQDNDDAREQAVFCIADLHAITVPQEPGKLRRNILETAKIYLAAGIDPQRSLIFVQSHVPEHTELAWIFNTIAKVGEMERMTQFKDKSTVNGQESASMGLFDYPVLMAADILLYDTAVVPVGEDQVQHVELARTLARRFNQKYGDTFVVPEASVLKEGQRIMGLDDPKKKMSKSASSAYNYIALTDDADTITKKIKKAVTDSGTDVVYSDEKPALKNLINIYSLLTDTLTKDVEKEYVGKGYAEFKKDLAEVIVNALNPLQRHMQEISDNSVRKILSTGAKKAEKIAKKKMKEVKEKMGLV